MAISSTGIGSGIDVQSIVSQLVALERRPIASLETAATFMQTQISAYGQIQSLTSSLSDAASALAKASLWQKASATSGDTSALTASATGSPTAGSYTVVASQLARSQSLASSAFASGAAVVGAGTLTIDVGTWAGDLSSHTRKAGTTALTLEFSEPGTTLAQVRDAINAAGAGVSAAIVQDASGARLTLTAKSTGLENALRVTATDSGGAPLAGGLGALAYAPDVGASGLTETQPAANALATINGLPIESPSNQLGSVLEGVSLTLLKASATPVSVTVASDGASQRKALQDFVNAYNALNAFLAEKTGYDEQNKVGGSLQSDSAAVGLRNQMRSMLQQTGGTSDAFDRLAQLGFDVQRDGSIKLDNAKLDAALAQPAEMAKLFSEPADVGNPGRTGLGVRMKNLLGRLVGSEGPLTSRTEGLQARLKRNEKDQDRLEDRVAQIEARLLRQYQALDASMGQLNSLSTYMTQQLSMLNNQFKSSNDN
jgi:flagellar hook-associated protein 2